MSLDIYPPVPLSDLKILQAETASRELKWIAAETIATCISLKHGLEECYALLAPIDPGSTLVVTTRGAERLKGTVTRVGTRIVKTSVNLQLQTLPSLHTLCLAAGEDLHIHALEALHTHLSEGIDLVSALVSTAANTDADRETDANTDTVAGMKAKAKTKMNMPHNLEFLAQTLSLLSESLGASESLLKGGSSVTDSVEWQTLSCPPEKFSPPLPPNLSVYVGVRDSCIVLCLRSLEPVNAPLHIGTRLGLAIGTVRRLEHDEMDAVFRWDPAGADAVHSSASSVRNRPTSSSTTATATTTATFAGRHHHHHQSHHHSGMEEVYVREKVRVETADPCLISLYSKVGFLSHLLGQARRNLAAVMDMEEP